jgi:pilus assembly protein CpaD
MSHARHPAPIACLLAVLLAAACSTPSDEAAFNAPVAASDAPLTHAVRFAPGTDKFSPAEGASLAQFLRKSGAHRGDTVTVAGGGDPIGEARRGRVTDALRRMGLAARPDETAVAAGRDSVVVVMDGVTVPPTADCPRWGPLGGADPTNAPPRNFGCATDANLYLMVADPADLVAGREPGAVDAEPGMRAVRFYREGPKDAPGGAGTEGTAPGPTAPAPVAPVPTVPTPSMGGSSGQP